MNMRTATPESARNTAITGRIKDACSRYGLGLSSMRKLAKEAGAEIHYGRSLLIDFRKVDAYMSTLAE